MKKLRHCHPMYRNECIIINRVHLTMAETTERLAAVADAADCDYDDDDGDDEVDTEDGQGSQRGRDIPESSETQLTHWGRPWTQ